MKRAAIGLLFLLMLPLASASFFDADELTVEMNISSDIDITYLKPDASMKRVEANLALFPRENWRQRILSLETTPLAKKSTDFLTFEWDRPTDEKLSFNVHASVSLKDGFVKINDKVPFPLIDIPATAFDYLEPSEKIDSNRSAISNIASELVSGEDDSYVVVFNIASWIRQNVEYSLSTLTAGVSQKASWVLENKNGVCDEITTLFIAMLRSIGIPARYISGVAYTNYNNINDFGPHAWAEVYFPGYGWVPYDITYGEFGFIDSSHISLRRSIDTDESSVKYRWEGWYVDINTEELKIESEIKSEGSKLGAIMDMEAVVFKNKVGFGSYNIIELKASNPDNYYIASEITISRSAGIQNFDEGKKEIMLKPLETKSVYWIVKIDDDLDPEYVYTFSVGFSDARNNSAFVNFSSTSKETILEYDDVQKVLDQKQEETEKTYSRNVDMSCRTVNEVVYFEDNVSIECTVKNSGNIKLHNLSVCMEECHIKDIGIAQSSTIYFTQEPKETGKKEAVITAKNEFISKSDSISYEVQDLPDITIVNVEKPDELDFGQPYKVTFTINRTSYSIPRNISIILNQEGIEKKWALEQLEGSQKYILNLDASNLHLEENDFIIRVSYVDLKGRSYNERKDFKVALKGASYIQRAYMFINNIGRSMDQFDLKMLVIAAFVFGIVMGFVFRGGVAKKVKHEHRRRRNI